ncbi:hypothetical protein F320042A7_29330 [Blautia producta]
MTDEKITGNAGTDFVFLSGGALPFFLCYDISLGISGFYGNFGNFI